MHPPPSAGSSANGIRQCNPVDATEGLEAAITAGVPLLLPGLVSSWPACRAWQGGPGLRRMASLAEKQGPQTVQVMYSSTSTFIGRLAETEPATLSMCDFLEEADRAAAGQRGPHLYLAQHTLDAGADLLVDAPVPACLQGKNLTSTNMWMCIRGSRSNIHYDPYTNLLCVAVGCKHVHLWPPTATPYMYPAPLTSDSSNHSMVNFAAPDYTLHPLFRHAGPLQQEVTLQAGDALFIPEGYWHQVDSTDITIAINFWWASPLMCILLHQPGHSLAHLRLTAAQAQGSLLQQLLDEVPRCDLDPAPSELPDSTQQQPLRDTRSPAPPAPLPAPPAAAAAAAAESSQQVAGGQASVVLTHREQTAITHMMTWISGASSSGEVGLSSSCVPPAVTADAEGGWVQWALPCDGLSSCLAALTPAELVHVLYHMSCATPHHVASLLTSHLTPLAAYLLTNKLEQAADDDHVFPHARREDTGMHMETETSSGTQQEPCSDQWSAQHFYDTLYGCVDDSEQVFARLLELRQELMQQVFSRMLQYVLR